MVDEPDTPSTETADTGDHATTPESESASVILASFENVHVAEHTVASLGHDFRHKARGGKAAAFIVTHNRDGSFKLVQSRVVTGSGVVASAIRITASVLAGFFGSISALKGAIGVTHAARERQSHVGRDDQRLAEWLDGLGPHAAGVLFVCTDEPTEQAVAARAEERGSSSTQFSRTEFLAFLDRLGDDYDWIRPAVAEPAIKASKSRPSRRGK